ncbi:hypothetical protein H7171_01410 [Candidatus Saccharibacteria bacterium]|nr:hypothetical protein [Candidatus Saccharibacteria bacterium]
MKKPLAAHRNYSNAEIVLLFIMLFMIAAIGLYVHNAKTDSDNVFTHQTKITREPNQLITGAVATSKLPVIVLNGVFTSSSKLFTIRLADGWKLHQSQVTKDALLTLNNDDLTPKIGVAPIVTDDSTGSYGTTGLFMYFNDAENPPVHQGVRTADLVTNDGLAVTKYIYSDPSTNTTQYLYIVSANDKVFSAQYTVNSLMSSHREAVETVIKSLRFNQ